MPEGLNIMPFIVFAVAFTVISIMVATSSTVITRSWRKPAQTRRLILAISVPLLILNLCVTTVVGADQSVVVHSGVLALDVASLICIAITIGANRITVTPARLPRRILAVGAHPDDIELACGGALAKFVDSGHEVHALIMTRGGTGGDESARVEEADAGSQFLGLSSLLVLELPDGLLPEHGRAMIEAIESVLVRLNPDIVLTHSANDRHQDHHAVHMATIRAARAHPAILAYESPSVTDQFAPRYFVDIEQYVEAKVESVRFHHSQRHRPYTTPEQVKALALVRGRQGAVKHAEAFETVRVVDSRLGQL
jgi:LmbE family N-acetylglucosaminyl deacetylase